jgi:hypothetical protein
VCGQNHEGTLTVATQSGKNICLDIRKPRCARTWVAHLGCVSTQTLSLVSLTVRWVSSRVRWLSGVGLSHIYADPLTKQQT